MNHFLYNRLSYAFLCAGLFLVMANKASIWVLYFWLITGRYRSKELEDRPILDLSDFRSVRNKKA